MKISPQKAILGACVFLLAAAVSLTASEGYPFKLRNTTKDKIVKLLASEDGKKWGEFDIGNGIGAGKTVDLVWDESTDEEDCEQWFKAVFADGEESEPVKFDFCEEDLTLEF